MMQVIGKSHEQRIADLERQIAELQRIVGAPHQGALGQWGQAQGLAQMQAGSLQAQNGVVSPYAGNNVQGIKND